MKKVRNIAIFFLAVLLAGNLKVAAAGENNDKLIQLEKTENETDVSLTIHPDADMKKDVLTTLRIQLQVSGVESASVVFSEEVDAKCNVIDYVYDENGMLDIYLSSPEALLNGGEGISSAGVISLVPGQEDYQAVITPVLVEYVNQAHQRTFITEEDLEGMAITLSGGTQTPPDVPEPPNPETSITKNYEEIISSLDDTSITTVIYQTEAGGEGLNASQQTEIFGRLKGTDRTFIVQVMKDGRLLYSLEFSGSTITDETVTMDFGLEIGAENKDVSQMLNKGAKNLLLDFKHSGNLPGPVKVTVYAGDVYQDGQTLLLYFYNPDKKALEPVQRNITVLEGYAGFELQHCSIYALTDQEVKGAGEFPGAADGQENDGTKSAKTGDTAPVVLMVVILVAAAALIVVILKKRRK